jgi:hypothetical protein
VQVLELKELISSDAENLNVGWSGGDAMEQGGLLLDKGLESQVQRLNRLRPMNLNLCGGKMAREGDGRIRQSLSLQSECLQFRLLRQSIWVIKMRWEVCDSFAKAGDSEL